ncbi:unnamed protein product [Paramecium octaurelia]|uniref:Uncharacterized protein n=1 Tax=Paramecium octaurelia TaxID=43137 RepID=A0A8S1T3G2_PAROT|nr:unnamed protein product [Paramecium octaurelia]
MHPKVKFKQYNQRLIYLKRIQQRKKQIFLFLKWDVRNWLHREKRKLFQLHQLILSHKIIIQKQSHKQEYYKEETDCNNRLKDLIAQEERPQDDLAELRRMIAQTEQYMVEYMDDMYRHFLQAQGKQKCSKIQI